MFKEKFNFLKIRYSQVVIGANDEVLHYVDKPNSFVSTHISCGVYLMKPELLEVNLEFVEVP